MRAIKENDGIVDDKLKRLADLILSPEADTSNRGAPQGAAATAAIQGDENAFRCGRGGGCLFGGTGRLRVYIRGQRQQAQQKQTHAACSYLLAPLAAA